MTRRAIALGGIPPAQVEPQRSTVGCTQTDVLYKDLGRTYPVGLEAIQEHYNQGHLTDEEYVALRSSAYGYSYGY